VISQYFTEVDRRIITMSRDLVVDRSKAVEPSHGLEIANVGKEFETSLEPRRWLNTTTLVVLAREGWSNEDDPNQTGECERTITISFDANGNASIQNIKKGKK
jgi:hypothetical protein